MIDVLKAQLLALRAQIDAMLSVIESVHMPTEQAPMPNGADTSSPADTGCPHPETVNMGTFQAPDFRCATCKASVPAPVG